MSDNKQKAREFLIKSKVYRFSAILFAGVGLMLFGMLFFQQADGDIMRVLSNPILLVILIIPFLPAFVFSMKANKMEKELAKILDGLE